MSNDLPYVEFRFKRDWESRNAGWVQGKSEPSAIWVPLKYARNVKSADRYVRKVLARRARPVQYVELPLESRAV
jgi:hypothetical protein